MMYLSLYLFVNSSDGNGDVAKLAGNSSKSYSGHSWTKNASPLSPSFIWILTGSPFTSMSTYYFNEKTKNFNQNDQSKITINHMCKAIY